MDWFFGVHCYCLTRICEREPLKPNKELIVVVSYQGATNESKVSEPELQCQCQPGPKDPPIQLDVLSCRLLSEGLKNKAIGGPSSPVWPYKLQTCKWPLCLIWQGRETWPDHSESGQLLVQIQQGPENSK